MTVETLSPLRLPRIAVLGAGAVPQKAADAVDHLRAAARTTTQAVQESRQRKST